MSRPVFILAPQINRNDPGSMGQFYTRIVERLEHKNVEFTAVDEAFLRSKVSWNMPILLRFYLYILLKLPTFLFGQTPVFVACSQEYVLPFFMKKQICIHYDMIQLFYPKNSFKKIFYGGVIPFVYPRLKSVYYLSETTKRITQKIIKIPVNWKGPTYVPSQFSDLAPEQSNRSPTKFSFLWVGALSEHKQFAKFVKAASVGIEPSAVVVPKGQHHEALRVVRELQAEPLVEVKSSLSSEEIENLFKRSNTLVNTSTCEGFGMPILEAISCGTQIVAPNRAINRELFDKISLYSLHDDRDLENKMRATLGFDCFRSKRSHDFSAYFETFLDDLSNELLEIQNAT